MLVRQELSDVSSGLSHLFREMLNVKLAETP